MKSRHLAFLFLFILILLGIISIVFAREISFASPSAPQNAGASNFTSLGTFWQLTAKAGGLRWAIFAVFILGIFLVAFKILDLYTEWKRSSALMNLNFRDLQLQEINHTVNGQPVNILSKIITGLLNIFQSTGSVSGLNEEIGNYVKYEQDKFDTFRTRLVFLSDTAGALGLLGTVWGMFLTFFTGTLDKQAILNGMGIALLTTLLGLIVSIILNLSTTEVYSLFQKLLAKVASKSEELRFRLLELSTQGIVPSPIPVVRPVSKAPIPTTTKEKQFEKTSEEKFEEIEARQREAEIEKQKASEEARRKKPAQICLDSPVPERVPASEQPIPCQGRVINDFEEGLAGIQLVAIVTQGAGGVGRLEQARISLTTDAKGQFRFSVYPGKKPGRSQYVIQLAEAKKDLEQRFAIEVFAGQPGQLKVQSGNHQSALIEKKLPRPLSVQVSDSFGNPVKGAKIIFAAKSGEGSFPNKKTEIQVQTDNQGTAATEFKLGKTPGLIVIVCEIEKTKLKTQFELFAQEEQ